MGQNLHPEIMFDAANLKHSLARTGKLEAKIYLIKDNSCATRY